MSEQFEVIEQAFGPVVEIEERVGMLSMPAAFARDYKRIMSYLQSQGAECAGMPYARYQGVEWDKELSQGKFATFFSMLFKKWHFFAGMPSSKKLQSDGALVARELASRRYVKAIHRGPYRNSGQTYKLLYNWAQQQGLTLGSEAIECYLNDPREVGQEELQTVILLPLQQ